MNTLLAQHLDSHSKMLTALYASTELATAWEQASRHMLDTLLSYRTVYIAGNGGSAADAQHFAAELVGRFQIERPGYPAVALTTDTSALTAISNDFGFDMVFARQLSALGKRGDCFIGITTSGNSPNILNAFKVARQRGIYTILLSGNSGGKALTDVDCAVVVPHAVTAHIQEAHLMLYHAWCAALESSLTASALSQTDINPSTSQHD
jgi:D-sedoheptulose 7-phosphate isomerase